MIGNTGGGISTERGFIIASSEKKNLNTRSSTETRIVAVEDCMPVILCTIYWLDAQGFYFFEKIIFQDNKIAIILENNVKYLSTKRTNYINIQYYFVTDRIEKYELLV